MKGVLRALITKLEEAPITGKNLKVDWDPYPVDEHASKQELTQDYMWTVSAAVARIFNWSDAQAGYVKTVPTRRRGRSRNWNLRSANPKQHCIMDSADCWQRSVSEHPSYQEGVSCGTKQYSVQSAMPDQQLPALSRRPKSLAKTIAAFSSPVKAACS